MTTKSIGHRRLERLADFLETLSPAELNMDNWLSDATDIRASGLTSVNRLAPLTRVSGTHVGWASTDPQQTVECGFAACALGWACMIPEFRTDGLQLTGTIQESYGADQWPADVTMVPFYGGRTGYSAALSFFNLPIEHVYHIFNGQKYHQLRPSPVDVAHRIRKVIQMWYTP